MNNHQNTNFHQFGNFLKTPLVVNLVIIFLLLMLPLAFAKTVPATYFKTTQDFIDKMVKEHNFNRKELTLIFSTVTFKIADKPTNKKKKKVKRVKKPPMAWDKYKGLFLTEERIQNGVKFWKNNLATLNRAEKTYNVPAEIIVAILGVETSYGNKKGTHPTFKVLTTRAFSNYRRRNFYKNELENFLLMSRENDIAPLSVKGSYAGAMGFPQFIASSYRHYAIDFNEDGKIDLFSTPIDAIGSIANYFDQHQWHDFGEVARPIALDSKHLKYAKRSNSKPKKNAQFWREKGFNIDADIHNKTKLAFIRLPQKNIDETWLTFWNFYVLTRYNHDNRYAMAVYQLSEKIKQQFNKNTD
jgi:membrane-bound lytic murein transglycosylase B